MSIKEIAKLAGVSPSTVSRILNNPAYKPSSPEIREKVWRIAIENNYTPNEAARNLKKGAVKGKRNNYYVTILMTRMDSAHVDPFFDELLRIVETEIHKNNCILSRIWYNSVFSDDKRCKRESLDRLIETMHAETEGQCNGLIIIGKCNKDAAMKLKKVFKNIVCINRNASIYHIDEIVCDGEKLAEIAVNYLISLGHSNIAYVGKCHNEARYRGYIKTLQKNEIEPELSYIIETKQTEAEGYDAMKKILTKEDCPTGIYCSNDITAIGMLKYLNQHRHFYTPSIIATDDIEEAQNTNPMLTTVKVPKEEMGKFALMLLLDRMKNGHTSSVRMELEGKLMARNSCTRVEDIGWNDYCI